MRAADRAAIFRICSAFNLSRGERIEVATVLLNRNVESFNDLSDAEVRRLRDALEGAVLVCTIQMERKRRQRV